MKGVIFNIVEEIVTEHHGEAAWDGLLADAGVSGAYTSLGSYSNAELGALVTAASSTLATPPDDVVRWLGREALPHFVARNPGLFERYGSTRELALALNDVIHPQVRRLYPGADVPVFDYDTSANGMLVMDYRSPRMMCSFAEGLLEGSADHYAESIRIDRPACMKRGDEKCTLEITLAG